jgi:ABC-2 type transport system permease protein
MGGRLRADAGERRLLSHHACCRTGCRSISWGLPPAYIFEGMRAIMTEKTVHWDMPRHRVRPVRAVYLVIGFQIFQWFFRLSRSAGTLLGQGE